LKTFKLSYEFLLVPISIVLVIIALFVGRSMFIIVEGLSEDDKVAVSSMASSIIEMYYSSDTTGFFLDNKIRVQIADAIPLVITSKDTNVVKLAVVNYINDVRDRWIELDRAGIPSPLAQKVALLEQKTQAIENMLSNINQKIISEDSMKWLIFVTFSQIVGLIALIFGILLGLPKLYRMSRVPQ